MNVGYVAKAITAAVLVGLSYLGGDPNLIDGAGEEVEAIIASILTGGTVFTIENGPKRSRA